MILQPLTDNRKILCILNKISIICRPVTQKMGQMIRGSKDVLSGKIILVKRTSIYKDLLVLIKKMSVLN